MCMCIHHLTNSKHNEEKYKDSTTLQSSSTVQYSTYKYIYVLYEQENMIARTNFWRKMKLFMFFQVTPRAHSFAANEKQFHTCVYGKYFFFLKVMHALSVGFFFTFYHLLACLLLLMLLPRQRRNTIKVLSLLLVYVFLERRGKTFSFLLS